MSTETLAIGAAIAAIAAGVFARVAYTVATRAADHPSVTTANRMFALWWGGLALSTITGPLQTVLALTTAVPLEVYTTLSDVSVLAISAGLWGLLYYLWYLFTGSQRALWPLGVLYGLLWAGLSFMQSWRTPIGVEIGVWEVELTYQIPLEGVGLIAILLLLVGPQILGALAYFTLYFRVEAPEQRFRIAMVSWGLIIWFVSALLASASGFSEATWWQVTSRLISLMAAGMTLLAFEPPGFLRDRWTGSTRSVGAA